MDLSMVQEIASSLTGDVAKAILCVRSPNSALVTDKEAVAEIDSLRESIMGWTANALSLGTTYNNVVGSGFIGNNYTAMEVQFNPSTLTISSQGEGLLMPNLGGDLGNRSANQLLQIHTPTYNTLQCQLVFDAVNIADAFMSTDISGSLGNVVSTVSSIVKKVTTGSSGYSVQSQVDGLMALLTHEITRQVVFIWGRFFFRGELMGVENTYTMFNKSGDPIRGVVKLTITQMPTDSELEYWNKAFEKKFKPATTADIVQNLSVEDGNNFELEDLD